MNANKEPSGKTKFTSTIQRFWDKTLSRGTLLPIHREWEGLVQTSKLYNEYEKFCEEIDEAYPLAINMFARNLRDITPPGTTERVQRRLPKEIKGHGPNPAKWCLRFDSLNACRKFLEGTCSHGH